MTEPFTVERLREIMEGGLPEAREYSTVLWAADEIERLRDQVAHLVSVVDDLTYRMPS